LHYDGARAQLEEEPVPTREELDSLAAFKREMKLAAEQHKRRLEARWARKECGCGCARILPKARWMKGHATAWLKENGNV
jgi:uncharacterized protein YfaT (DUF1175 family)